MENYFSNEIKNIKSELTNLKTASQKSATTMQTVSQSVQVNIPLSLHDTYFADGEVTYKISADTEALFSFTLDKYYDDIYYDLLAVMHPRIRGILPIKNEDNSLFLLVQAVGDENDVQTLTNGGSVTITNTLTIRATAPFTITQV